MAGAALFISILSFLASGAAALYAKHQRDAARAALAIERARREDEVASSRVAHVHAYYVKGEKFSRLRIRNDGPADARDVSISLATEIAMKYLPEGGLVGDLDRDQRFEYSISRRAAGSYRWTDGTGSHERPIRTDLGVD